MSANDFNTKHMPLVALTPLGLFEEDSLPVIADRVRAFQASHGLTIDGYCGRDTVRACLEEMTGAPLPRMPFKLPSGYEGIHELFGDPGLVDDPKRPGFMLLTSSEYRSHVKKFVHAGFTFWAREELGPHLIASLEWLAANLHWQPHRIDSWVPRRKRNGSANPSPSIHSYGLAFDFDPIGNERGRHDPMIPQIVFLALWAMGWVCGRFWTGISTDPMHLQAAEDC